MEQEQDSESTESRGSLLIGLLNGIGIEASTVLIFFILHHIL